jgi:hypothetical protein
MPVMPGIPPTTGSVFFVHSGTGSNDNAGNEPGAPLATIDAAVGRCTASKGDVIIVMPGHAENISAATSLVVDVAGISIIGLGWGGLRPTLSFTNTAGRIPVSAANVLIENLLCVGAVADIVSGITITGDDVTLRNVEMRSGSAILEFLQFLDIDAASRVRLEGVRIIASATAGTNTGIRIDATVDCVLEGCELRGDFTTAAVSGNAGSGAASTNLRISRCTVENVDTTAGLTVDNHDSTTGICEYNSLLTLFATAPETAFDPGNALCIENYAVNAVDESGTIVPTVLST